MKMTDKEICDQYIKDEINYYLEIDRCNDRLLRAIETLKGEQFVNDLKECMEESEQGGRIIITNKTAGQYQDEDWGVIKGAWIDQHVNGGMTGDDFQGNIYIRIKAGKYLCFGYAM